MLIVLWTVFMPVCLPTTKRRKKQDVDWNDEQGLVRLVSDVRHRSEI